MVGDPNVPMILYSIMPTNQANGCDRPRKLWNLDIYPFY